MAADNTNRIASSPFQVPAFNLSIYLAAQAHPVEINVIYNVFFSILFRNEAEQRIAE